MMNNFSTNCLLEDHSYTQKFYYISVQILVYDKFTKQKFKRYLILRCTILLINASLSKIYIYKFYHLLTQMVTYYTYINNNFDRYLILLGTVLQLLVCLFKYHYPIQSLTINLAAWYILCMCK